MMLATTVLKIGERIYEFLSPFREGEKTISCTELVSRAQGLDANLGKEDWEYIYFHRAELPTSWKKQQTLILFTAWLNEHLAELMIHLLYVGAWDWSPGEVGGSINNTVDNPLLVRRVA